ncbi:glycoside hydrolase family 5 protein [Roseibium litorale]|uniref:Cellulase family glycosylhydrolase n=1 Tax=Roseibium litorale TaxID=2803841 RepID=A0ABR9CQ47_9HYPH|nr:cellulase family glycosylhydrolase [Roseibium litorale]MBD8892422.1 cellulase family glycosylhydrolase [Roseibium litorale]
MKRGSTAKIILGLTALATAACLAFFFIALRPQVMLQASAANTDQQLQVPHFRRGINLPRLLSFAYRDPAKPGAYLWPPFQGGMSRFSDDELKQLTGLGFDFVRLPVDAGPFLAASEPDRRLLLDDMRAWVLRLLDNNLTVMVDMHPATYASIWRPEDILKDPEGPAFAAYQGLLRDVARRIKDLPADKIALELMNEPQPRCVRESGEDWTVTQRRLYDTVREAAPDLPLVLTGGCWSSIDGLATLDPAGYDSRTLYDIHFYEPHFFTHQSLIWASPPARYIAGLSYPWTNGSVERTEQLTKAHLDQLAKSGHAQPDNAFAQAAKEIRSYYGRKRPDKATMGSRFKVISDWAERYGLSHSRIVIGEFGAARIPDYIPDDSSRIAWYRDLRLTAEENGFGWALWDDHAGFGILTGNGNTEIDRQVVEALGLNAAGLPQSR